MKILFNQGTPKPLRAYLPTQYGRPTMLLVRYEDGMEMMREMAGKRLINLLDERAKDAPAQAREISEEELNEVVQ